MANLEHAEDDPKHTNMSSEVSSQAIANGPSTVATSDPGTIHCMIPNFAEACKLVSARYSCLVMDTHRRHITLSPMYLNKKKTGIQEELNTELLKYAERLKGVPLAYDNIKILGHRGDIFDDSGYIHLDIQADFVIFQPQKGRKLLGVVNKLGVNHVGCLVHNCFNASIPKPSKVSVDTWKEAGPRIGAELEFEVSQLDADYAGVLLIRGHLDRTRVEELQAAGQELEAEQPGEPNPDPPPEPSPTLEPAPEPAAEPTPEDSPDNTPKKKKKKKDKHKEEEREVAVTAATPDRQDSGTTQELNGTVDDAKSEGEPKKKKKKKEKQIKEEETGELQVSRTEVPGSDSSGYLSDKPSKKRKQEVGDDFTSIINDIIEPPKAKKKRKSDKKSVA